MGIEKIPAKTIATCDGCGVTVDITDDDSEMLEWADVMIGDQTINPRIREYRGAKHLACPKCRKRVTCALAEVFL